MSELATRLRQSPMVGAVGNPYYNVAGCLYVRAEDVSAAARRIEELEAQVAAYERYLNGDRRSASGVPITRKP